MDDGRMGNGGQGQRARLGCWNEGKMEAKKSRSIGPLHPALNLCLQVSGYDVTVFGQGRNRNERV